MRFTDFLRSTVMLSAAAATVLAVVAVASATSSGLRTVELFAVAWWIVAALTGMVLGRRADASPPIARLLAGARSQRALPDVRAGRIMLNRLWPLLLATVVGVALAFLFPQVTAIAAGFAIIWSLAWRHQDAAVDAIEKRDGVRFYVEAARPWEPMTLVRAPGFKSGSTGFRHAA